MNSSPPLVTAHPEPVRHLRHRWPAALGLMAAAAMLALGVNRESVVLVVGVAALCYLGAAALGRPWVAWAGIVGGTLVAVASEWVGVPWWAGIGTTALLLVGYGLVGGAHRPALRAQSVALAGFGGLAVVALHIAPRIGLALAGTALVAHAVWDFIHYRRRQVVPRSLAEFCMVLDVPLGTGAVLLAIAG